VYVFDLLVGEIALVNAVEALDVGVALVLERGPVEGGGLLDIEAICFCLVNGLGDKCGVVGDLFGDATTRGSRLATSYNRKYA